MGTPSITQRAYFSSLLAPLAFFSSSAAAFTSDRAKEREEASLLVQSMQMKQLRVNTFISIPGHKLRA
jgi:hypothetical protein